MNKNEPFPHKKLLIFSGICWSIALLSFYVMGLLLKLAITWEYTVLGFLVIVVPLATHLYMWGRFCEWKNIRILPSILKGSAILYVIAVAVGFFIYLLQQ